MLDLAARIWKGAFRMWIVRAPHQTVEAHQMAGQHARAVVFEGGPEITLEVKRRRVAQPRLNPVVVVLPEMIHEPQRRRDPSHAAFGQHELDPGMALRDARRD